MYQSEFMSEIAQETLLKQQYNFQLPTKITKLDPVFLFSFNVNKTTLNTTLMVALNPKLIENSSKTKFIKEFTIDENKILKFNHEEFSNYFIEGEIQLLLVNDDSACANCFVSITYGNSNDALHFIKGKFQLTENII